MLLGWKRAVVNFYFGTRTGKWVTGWERVKYYHTSATFEWENIQPTQNRDESIFTHLGEGMRNRPNWNERGDGQILRKPASNYLIFQEFSFLDNLDRLCKKNYVPTVQDILMCRVPTTGVQEIQYDYKGITFRWKRDLSWWRHIVKFQNFWCWRTEVRKT